MNDSEGAQVPTVHVDATSAGNSTDGIKYSYDAWGNLERFEQDRNSAVAASGGDEYDVSYAWVKATNGRNTLRKTNMLLPGSRSISFTYRCHPLLLAGCRVVIHTASLGMETSIVNQRPVLDLLGVVRPHHA